MSNGHRRLSPSGAERYLWCLGSIYATDGIIDRGSSYADEGSGAHCLLEVVVLEKYDIFGDGKANCYTHIGRRFNVADEGKEPVFITVDMDMANHVQTVVDYIDRRVQEMSVGPNGERTRVEVYAERKVSPYWILKSHEHDGTADVTLVSPYEVEVVDLKFGRGVVVEVGTRERPNPQFMLYTVGAVEGIKLDGLTFSITAAQPRAYHQDGPIRSLRGLTAGDILGFATWFKERVALIKPDAPRTASEEACRFCKAKKGGQRKDGTMATPCRTYVEWASQEVGAPTSYDKASFMAEIQAFATRNPQELTPAEAVRILKGTDILKGMLIAVEEWAHEALKGDAPPELAAAYKLVRGRSQRRWVFENEESILKDLTGKLRWKDPVTGKTTGLGKKVLVTEKLKSPTQVELLLKAEAQNNENFTSTHWEAFKRLVTKPEGSLQLAPISDERENAVPRGAAMFTSVAGMAPPPIVAPQDSPIPTPPPVSTQPPDFDIFN
jgi:hypothetical protein